MKPPDPPMGTLLKECLPVVLDKWKSQCLYTEAEIKKGKVKKLIKK